MRVVAFAALCAALGGCASVTRGTTETISVASTPAGAEATIAGLEAPMTCTTPCSFVAKRNADLSVTIDKPGYETETVTLTKDIPATGAAGFAGNILLGGLIGMGVDAATGAATDHKPNPVVVTLRPRGMAPAARGSRPPRRSAPPPTEPEAGT